MVRGKGARFVVRAGALPAPQRQNRVAALLVIGLAALSACSGDESGQTAADAANETSSSSTSSSTALTSSTDLASSTTSATAKPSSTASTITRSASTSATATATSTTPGSTLAKATSGPSLAFADLWRRRVELLNTVVRVDAKVLFRLDCASSVPGGPPCVATGFVTDQRTDDLPLYTENQAFPLYIGGQAVACRTVTLDASFSCMGWRQGATGPISGQLQYLVLGGRQTNDIGFIASKEQ